jgi:hypothetical protein
MDENQQKPLEKICPEMSRPLVMPVGVGSVSVVSGSGQGQVGFAVQVVRVPCMREACGKWDKDYRRCSIVSLAVAL